jgi:hypothetical protein
VDLQADTNISVEHTTSISMPKGRGIVLPLKHWYVPTGPRDIPAQKTNINTDVFSFSLMERQKTALLEALSRKGSALCRLYTITNAVGSKARDGDGQEQLSTASASAVSLDSIDSVYRDVLRFTDANDTKVCT